MVIERAARRALIVVALVGLVGGLAAILAGRAGLAHWIWAAGAIPVAASLAVSIIRSLLAGRMGVDAIALLSMLAALALGEALAAAVVAVMYAGGAALEDFAVGRAERDLKSLVDRAPRLAHRRIAGSIEDVPIDQVSIGDAILVQAGEVVPVDGQIVSLSASIDESALTGEPIPVMRRAGEVVSSGAINAGETFEMQASATAGESAYAGIIGMVTAAQTAKAPFIRMADRYALLLLPVTLVLAGAAWAFSHDPIRGLAVLVAATPCPLILAAPAAFIAGASQAARRGILIKGGGPLEALARTHTVMFDKTGTLTVGGARLVAIETAPGQDPDEALRLAASLEQASHHVVAAAIVSAALEKGLSLQIPAKVRETMGSGLEGIVEGREIRVGSHQLVCGAAQPEEWALRALRRASWRSALSVFVSVDGRTIAGLLLADELRRETPRAIQALRAAGVTRIVMVTGDRADSAETIGAALNLDAVLADRVPADKVDAVATEQQRLHPTTMVGDGINDAPALAAADVGVAMGARGASASSEAADVVILVDRLDRVSTPSPSRDARHRHAKHRRGHGAFRRGDGAAALGWLTPVAGALTQEAIDVAVILNALRALSPGRAPKRPTMPAAAARILHEDHERLAACLDRLRQIADALDDAKAETAVSYIAEANRIVAKEIVAHERDDESSVYPRLSSLLAEGAGLGAMSRAHREILHLARLLARLSDGLAPAESDRYVIRDAQRIIESIEALVRIHNAQEEDIYEQAVDWGDEVPSRETRKPAVIEGGEAPGRGPTGRPPSERRWGRQIAVVVFAILAFENGWLYWSLYGGGAIRYATQKLDRGSVARIVATSGGVSAATTAQIGARVSGQIQAVLCQDNEKVKAGQLCAKIDPRPYQIAVEQEKANLAAAEARLEQSKAELGQARSVLDRNEAPAKRRGVSRKALAESRKAYEQAQARTMADEASLAERQTALKAAETNLSYTDIVSPADGTVASRKVEARMTVAADPQAPLFLIATNLSAMRVDANVGERDIGEIKLGDKASLTVEALPNRSFAGEVTQISQWPRTVETGATYDVVIAASNPDLLLEPGMKATVRIVTERRDDVLRAPDQALGYSPGANPSSGGGPTAPAGGASRLWILRDGKPIAIPVQLGLDDGAFAEIVKGDLQPGDDVIVGESRGGFGKTPTESPRRQ
ncbi:heavy metal translocating P-type ATPase [Methylocapsa polymorpha]|uniref:P-type Zn(2+) transporter n=1 Tax=Methylocapsa polymorpha TaxID=3080828 RepID=A0ABZ0HNT3_9HYPH|nr:heavy metal translocating P-type ATPase [Methylocapsa sp. RX1]